MPLLHDRLRLGGLVVLDDHDRDEEREIGERWRAAYPGLRLELLPHEKGTALFHRDA
jgi:hypothetical protein